MADRSPSTLGAGPLCGRRWKMGDSRYPISHILSPVRRAAAWAVVVGIFGLAAPVPAQAQLLIERTVEVNQTIADRGQYVSTVVWSDTGLSSISRVTVQVTLSSPHANDPMWLGDMFASLTHGTALGEYRTATLFDYFTTDPFNSGSTLSASYTPAALHGDWLASNQWSLLVADGEQGGIGRLNSWKLTVEGDASSAGATLRMGSAGKIRLAENAPKTEVGATVLLDVAGTFETGAGQSIQLNGAVAGGGDLIKVGEGELVLAGPAADFTGNVRVEQGTLEVRDAAALGEGVLVQSNSSSLVRFSAAGTISNALSLFRTAFGTNGTTLAGTVTVSNAVFDVAGGNTNTITGAIEGSGGVTKTGLGTLVLGGTTTNTFTGASAVDAGTLLLNKRNGATAISGSTIAVNSGGTLLLGAANQISSGTEVNLAGGALDTAGFADQVGRLTIHADSSIRGLQAAASGSDFLFAEVDLSTYSGGGYGLTLIGNYGYGSVVRLSTSNFMDWTGYSETTMNSFTSKIQFGSPGLRGQLAFGNGFTTLTAIPEPGMSLAAGVLVVLIGWTEVRRRTRGGIREREGKPVSDLVFRDGGRF